MSIRKGYNKSHTDGVKILVFDKETNKPIGIIKRRIKYNSDESGYTVSIGGEKYIEGAAYAGLSGRYGRVEYGKIASEKINLPKGIINKLINRRELKRLKEIYKVRR